MFASGEGTRAHSSSAGAFWLKRRAGHPQSGQDELELPEHHPQLLQSGDPYAGPRVLLPLDSVASC